MQPIFESLLMTCAKNCKKNWWMYVKAIASKRTHYWTLKFKMALGWHVIEFARWQHPAMWYMALGWHAVEFARWQHLAMWQVALGWHAIEFTQMSAILEFYIWFTFWPYHRSRHVILYQSAKFYPNRTTLSRKNYIMSIFKMADLSHLGF